MKAAPLPPNEADRLQALHRYQILDTGAETAFDNLTQLAAQICQSPISLISFVDENRHWFKSKCGLSVDETSRDIGVCAHALWQPEDLLTIADTWADERFADNPLVVSDPHIRFYVGAPLIDPHGDALGTLCVIDQEPRHLPDYALDSLRALSAQVVNQLQLRLTLDRLAQMHQTMHQYIIEVEHLTRAAAKLEAGQFDPIELSPVLARSDELGQLAQVFQRAAQEVIHREQCLQQQVVNLKIEIDLTKKEREVSAITESEHFRVMQAKAKELRSLSTQLPTDLTSDG